MAISIGATDPEQILFQYLQSGSLKVGFVAAVNPDDNFDASVSNFQDRVNNNQVPYFTLLGSSLTVNGQSSTSSSANLGLILGITIPLVVLCNY